MEVTEQFIRQTTPSILQGALVRAIDRGERSIEIVGAPRPRVGVRLKRAKSSSLLSPFGAVVGWDDDLGMLLVQWDGERGPEAVTPDEYGIINPTGD